MDLYDHQAPHRGESRRRAAQKHRDNMTPEDELLKALDAAFREWMGEQGVDGRTGGNTVNAESLHDHQAPYRAESTGGNTVNAESLHEHQAPYRAESNRRVAQEHRDNMTPEDDSATCSECGSDCLRGRADAEIVCPDCLQARTIREAALEAVCYVCEPKWHGEFEACHLDDDDLVCPQCGEPVIVRLVN